MKNQKKNILTWFEIFLVLKQKGKKVYRIKKKQENVTLVKSVKSCWKIFKVYFFYTSKDFLFGKTSWMKVQFWSFKGKKILQDLRNLNRLQIANFEANIRSLL